LRNLLRKIEAHNNGLPQAENLHVVLLGDVIDRGPHSAKALRFLKDWQHHTQGQVMLQGNHEEMMLRVYEGERRLIAPWLRFGGKETLESFGLEIADTEDFSDPRLLKQIREALPSDLMAFVKGWAVTARSGDYFFCHAGVRPRVELAKQVKNDLIWIREEFLESPVDHGAMIVHGHSITDQADLRSNRIGIDTGAYRSGILTAVYLEGTERDFIAVQGTPARPAYADV